MSDNIVQLRRRWSGATTAPVPSTVKTGELIIQGAGDDVIVYLGRGDDGSGYSTSVEAVAGRGAVVMLTGPQSIADLKTFLVAPSIPTVAAETNDGTAASTAFVHSLVQTAVDAVTVQDGNKGDITVSNNGATWTIPTISITYNKLAMVPAGSFIANLTGGTTYPRATSISEVKAALGVTNASNLDSGTIAAECLPGLTGDVVSEAGTNSTSISDGVVSLAKMAALPAKTLIGNNTAGSATPTALTAVDVMNMLGAAPLNNPSFTGIPSAPTAAPGTNTTQIATTAFVSKAVADLVSGAPEALNTLQELADALGDDPNFAATLATNLGNKLEKTANLSDLSSVEVARSNLGLGSLALQNANAVAITGGVLANVTLQNATIDAGTW